MATTEQPPVDSEPDELPSEETDAGDEGDGGLSSRLETLEREIAVQLERLAAVVEINLAARQDEDNAQASRWAALEDRLVSFERALPALEQLSSQMLNAVQVLPAELEVDSRLAALESTLPALEQLG